MGLRSVWVTQRDGVREERWEGAREGKRKEQRREELRREGKREIN